MPKSEKEETKTKQQENERKEARIKTTDLNIHNLMNFFTNLISDLNAIIAKHQPENHKPNTKQAILKLKEQTPKIETEGNIEFVLEKDLIDIEKLRWSIIKCINQAKKDAGFFSSSNSFVDDLYQILSNYDRKIWEAVGKEIATMLAMRNNADKFKNAYDDLEQTHTALEIEKEKIEKKRAKAKQKNVDLNETISGLKTKKVDLDRTLLDLKTQNKKLEEKNEDLNRTLQNQSQMLLNRTLDNSMFRSSLEENQASKLQAVTSPLQHKAIIKLRKFHQTVEKRIQTDQIGSWATFFSSPIDLKLLKQHVAELMFNIAKNRENNQTKIIIKKFLDEQPDKIKNEKLDSKLQSLLASCKNDEFPSGLPPMTWVQDVGKRYKPVPITGKPSAPSFLPDTTDGNFLKHFEAQAKEFRKLNKEKSQVETNLQRAIKK